LQDVRTDTVSGEVDRSKTGDEECHQHRPQSAGRKFDRTWKAQEKSAADILRIGTEIPPFKLDAVLAS
jgi:hypothetical protein